MKISKIAFAITALIAASQVNAAGFQINEHSASGLGRANSGEAAIGDNAAAVGRNPALMARFDNAQLSLVGTYIMPEINMESDDVGTQSGRNEDVAPDAAVPAMYYIQPLSDDFAFGLAIYSGFGMSTDYEGDYVYGSSAGTTEIVTMNFNPNFSYRLNDSLSIGVGVDFVYATAKLKRNAGITVTIPKTTIALTDPSTTIADIEGDGYGIGWNAGALYEINENNRLGISYRSKVKLELEGDYKGTSSATTGNMFGAQDKVAGELDINLPSVLEVSAYHKLTDSFAIMYDWQYTTWSDFGDIEANSVDASKCKDSTGIQGRCLTKEEDFEDSNRYAVGAEFYPSESVTLRLGYAFDEQAAKSTLSIPDSDRQWFTTGMTFAPSDTLSFDLAVAYILGEEGTFEEDVPLLASVKPHYTFESTSSDAYIFSAQMNYSF